MASLVSTLIVNPLDVIKVRLQKGKFQCVEHMDDSFHIFNFSRFQETLKKADL